jgi:hypothetical protein
MNAPLRPDVLGRLAPPPQHELPLTADGVVSQVWQSRFGPMLIEIRHGRVFVNGSPVEPAGPSDGLATGASAGVSAGASNPALQRPAPPAA